VYSLQKHTKRVTESCADLTSVMPVTALYKSIIIVVSATTRQTIYLFIYLFSSSTSNGTEVQAKNVLAE